MQLGLSACLNAAATARAAGLDLFAEEQARLAGAMEFAAGWLLVGGTPQSPLLCSGEPLSLALVATFELGYRELGARLRQPLPRTAAHLGGSVRQRASPEGACSAWETLTHGEPLDEGGAAASRGR